MRLPVKDPEVQREKRENAEREETVEPPVIGERE
jgi:hypothetical protein